MMVDTDTCDQLQKHISYIYTACHSASLLSPPPKNIFLTDYT